MVGQEVNVPEGARSRSPPTGELIRFHPFRSHIKGVFMSQYGKTDVELKQSAGRHISEIASILTINGEERHLAIEPWTTLLDLLRDKLDLTGTKKGCDHGQCGACTVLIDGTRVNACLKLAVSLDGCEITTIEGLGEVGNLHPLQVAFVEHDAFQCGYCTPGQICSAQGLMNEGHAHSRLEVREQMSGNICRCGAYTNIADAVLEVLEREEKA